MGGKSKKSLSDLVREVKEAIQVVQSDLDKKGYEIIQLDLELKTLVEKVGSVDAKLSVIPLGFSGSHTDSDVHTVNLSLIPEKAELELLAPIEAELADALEVISDAVEEAAQSKPVFGLSEASITINFGVTKEGKISVIVGVKGKHQTTHSVTIKLKKQAAE